MKLKCSNCGKIVSKRKDVFNNNIRYLKMDPEDYKALYLCKDCRYKLYKSKYFEWYDLSKINLPEWVIEKYKNRINWGTYLQHHKIEDLETFIEKFKNNVDWDIIIRTQKLSEPILRKYCSCFDRYEWLQVWIYTDVSESFIEEYARDDKDWYYISEYQNMSLDFIIKHIDKIKANILYNTRVLPNIPDSVVLLLKQKSNS